MWTCHRTREVVAIAIVGLFITLGLNGRLSMVAAAQETPFWTDSKPGRGLAVQAPDFAALVEHLQPAVVNISTTEAVRGPQGEGRQPAVPSPFGRQGRPFEEFFRRYFGDLPQREAPRHSLGSGFLITNDGYIVTNNHVVEHAADIKVALSNQEEFTAKVVGRDPKTDVALIKIDAPHELPVVPLGDSDQERVGGWVLAIGNPFGLGQTVTAGIISAKGRVIGAGPYDDFIQTDASINPGNSGGPLFNLKGDVIGINMAIVASGQGIGFATPINLAKGVLSQLRDQGQVTRGWLGVQVQPVTPGLAKSFGLNHERGVLVADVMAGSPAAQAGIQRGDIIVAFNGQKIAQANELPRMVANTLPGSKVETTLIRKGQRKTVRLTVAELKEEHMAAGPGPIPEQGLGLTVQELTPEIARRMGVSPQTQGVVVTQVQEGSPADEAGVQQGDLILEVNHQKIHSPSEYHAALGRGKGTDSALFLVQRGDNVTYMAMRPGQ
jgi:serine protease Do